MIKLALIVFLVISSVFSCETDPLLDYQNDSRGTQTVTLNLPVFEDFEYFYSPETLSLNDHNITLMFRTGKERKKLNDLDSVSCPKYAFLCTACAVLSGATIGTVCTLGSSSLLGCVFGSVVGGSVFWGCALTHICLVPVSCCIGYSRDVLRIREIHEKAMIASRLSSITYPKSLDLHDVISFLTTKGYINELDLESATHTKQSALTT